METKHIILVGGGGHARVVLDCFKLLPDIEVIGFFDANPSATLRNIKHLGQYAAAIEPHASVVVTIGNNETRQKVVQATRHAFATIVHSSCLLSDAKFGEGTMILHGAIVQTGSVIGRHCIINTRASVDHDCTISDFVHIAPGAVLCGGVTIGWGTLVGAGATILPGIKVGPGAVIGAGAVVVKDVPERTIVAGNPARTLHHK